jgi:hypothetical protein
MGKGAQKKASAAADVQAGVAKKTLDIGEKLIAEGEPARKTAMGAYSAIAAGKPGELQRVVAPSINAATSQFYLARRQALNLPPGGARDQALRDLAATEAATKTNIYSGGVSEALARLGELGWGGITAGFGAMTSAGAGFADVAKTQAQLASAKASGAGEAAGAGGTIAAVAIMA